MAFKMKGSSFYGSPLKQTPSTKKGAIGTGSVQETPGPVVANSGIYDTPPRKYGTSKNIGPEESKGAVNEKRKKMNNSRPSRNANPKEVRANLKAMDTYTEARDFQKATRPKKK